MNVRTQKIQKPFMDKNGRLKVSLYKNKKRHTVKVYRVIAETFLGVHPDMDVRHKDRNHSNNRVDNLEWCTRSELIKDAYLKGTKKPRRA